MAKRLYPITFEPPLKEQVYVNHVIPIQKLFKDNQNFLIKAKGYNVRQFCRMLLNNTGIVISDTALAQYKSRGASNMYYFCSVAMLLEVNVADLFRPDFIEQYLAGNIKDVIYPQPEPGDTAIK